MSDLKTGTSFGFLSPNYTRQSTDFFVKPQNGLVALVFEKRCFSGIFRDKIGPLSSNHFFSKSEANYERKSSSLNTFFEKNRPITKLSLVHASTIPSRSGPVSLIS